MTTRALCWATARQWIRLGRDACIIYTLVDYNAIVFPADWQPGKLGLGEAKYSVSWLDRGGLVLQSRIEPAPPSSSSSGLVATLVLEQGR